MSAGPSVQSRIKAIEGLAKLPLFQLSTAGMELFHTNMLYWLAAERPDNSFAVWQALGLPDEHRQPAYVRREWHRTDLVAWSGDDQLALVLENKIGAIPNPAQLDGYYAAIKSARPRFALDQTAFVLLTLTRPSFALPEPWRSVVYRDLLPTFRETAQRLTGADAGLIESYADMIARLDAVAATFDPARDLDAPYALSPDERSLLTETRLLVWSNECARDDSLSSPRICCGLNWVRLVRLIQISATVMG